LLLEVVGQDVAAGDRRRHARNCSGFLAQLGRDAGRGCGGRLRRRAARQGGGSRSRMSASALRSVAPASPADVWHAVLRPDVELSPAFCAELSARMRAARLTFGERIHCPFLRPFFLSEQDERRVREVAETIAELGERIVATALRAPALLAQVALNPEEERLARMEPGYARASTASRLDAFLLPDSLQFAEYNAESPAGPGYAETLAEIFRALPVMARFEERFSVRMYPLMAALLAALVRGYAARAVCVANSLRCKIPHKKAFFAVLTDERNRELFTPAERELIQRHVPWTRLLGDVKTTCESQPIELLEYVRGRRTDFVLKPNDDYGGAGVTLGWETDEHEWDAELQRALADRERAWVVQKRIAVRREIFPMQTDAGVQMRDMLVDIAPYLFRGRMAGFLTRLSATGLANVTSGGGQVPAFVVGPRVGGSREARHPA